MVKAWMAVNFKSRFGHSPQVLPNVLPSDFAVVCYCHFHGISSLSQELDTVDNLLLIFGYNAHSLINEVHSVFALISFRFSWRLMSYDHSK